MTLEELKNYLKSNGVEIVVANGKVQSIALNADAKIDDVQAWEVIDESKLRADESDIPTQPLGVTEDWGAFRIAMLNDPGYKAIINRVNTTTPGTLLIFRVESEIREQDTNLAMLQILWADLLNAAITPPSASTVERWNDYCKSAGMPFQFAADGRLLLP